tara:strand:+ start:544 stop:1368 length:825 start_codon:yes stop_codon:yes gene_type:complete
MAVNKNFVVKNGIEVATNLLYGTSALNKVGIGSTIPSDTLDVRGGIAATDISASGYINVAGVSTFTGIVTTGTDLYVGGDLYVADDLTFDEATVRNLNVSGVSTTNFLLVAGVSTFSDSVTISGITTLASSGGITTTGGDFYVGGDLYVKDDVVYDSVTGREINVTGVATFGSGSGGTTSGVVITGAAAGAGATVGGQASGIVTYYGDGTNLTLPVAASGLGISSEGSYVGGGVTAVNFASSNTTAINVSDPSSGLATVTVTPGASIGLVLALS